MALVEDTHGSYVLGAGRKAGLLVPSYHVLDIGGQFCEQLSAALYPTRHARRAPGHQQADQRGRLIVEDVLHGQLPTPGTPEEVEPIELQSTSYCFDLAYEMRDRPQRRVVRLVRAPAAELVVEDDPASGAQVF